MYVKFFHGRNNPAEQLDDWGFEGPYVGPLSVSWTYGWIRFHDNNEFHHVVMLYEDLIPIDKSYYGDFYLIEDDKLPQEEKDNVMSLKRFIELNLKYVEENEKINRE